MSWYVALSGIIGALVVLMSTGMPVALAFMIVNVVGIWLLIGEPGLAMLSTSFLSSVASFTLLAIPMFILMGELLFRAKIADNVLDAVDIWLGSLPGRLGLLVTAVGTLFGTFTGSSTATTALLGSTLAPRMQERGYSESMTLGPILASGGLAIMIPPSALAVVLGAIGQISVGAILLAIILPGITMAVLYGAYIIGVAVLRPDLAPSYRAPKRPVSEKIIKTVKYILPLGFLMFLVVGLMMLGVATPEESAATGVVGAAIMVIAYGRATITVFVDSIRTSLVLTGMILLLVVGATAFSQLLSFTGATGGMVQYVITLSAPPLLLVAAMVVVVLLLGCFMGPVAIMLITLPTFIPAVMTLGFDPVWFAVLFLIAIETGFLTPPYGINLFVLKGIVSGTTFRAVTMAAVPYVILNIVAIIAIMLWPAIALWLPGRLP